MSRRMSTLAATAVFATGLALAGCSGPGTSADLDPEKSPLSEFYSVIYGDFDENSWIEDQKKVEELVAACMNDEGFDYIPVDQSQNVSFDDGEDRDTEEWVAANGYGYFLTDEQMEEQNSQATEFVDPNQDYVMALSPSEQTAYYEVLYGPQPTEEELGEDGSYEYNWETAGCQGAAQHEIQGEQPYEDPQYADLLESMNTIYDKVQADPEIKKIDAEWSSCMADAGFSDLKNKNAVWDIMNEKSEKAYTDAPDGNIDSETRIALHEEEVELALADFRCTEKVDYSNRSLAVQFRLEQQFIDDNKAALDAMVADYEQGK